MPNVHLITFGDGSKEYIDAAQRLIRESNNFDSIDHRRSFGLKDLGVEYEKLFKESVRFSPKGLGLFAWKPFLISQELASIDENDILIYMDSGFELNVKGIHRFDDYLSITSEQQALTFELQHPQRYWTKRSSVLTESHQEHKYRNQIAAGIIFLKKTKLTKKFCDDWLWISSYNGGETLEDPQPLERQISGFKSHRHDQSTLSLAVYINDIYHIKDETYFNNWSDALHYPVLALRNKSAQQQHPRLLGNFQRIKNSIREAKLNYRTRKK